MGLMMRWRCTSCGRPVRLRGVSRVQLEREHPELDGEMLDRLAKHRRWRCAPCKTQGFLRVEVCR